MGHLRGVLSRKRGREHFQPVRVPEKKRVSERLHARQPSREAIYLPETTMTETNHDHDPKVDQVYAHDRAAVVACAVLAIVRDALTDPELRTRIAETLRVEFADLERQVINENRPIP